MSLERVGKLVAQHSAAPTETQEKLTKAETEQALLRKMFTSLKWGMIILGLGVVMLAISKNFDIGRWLHLLASFFMLGGVCVAASGLFDAMIKGVKLSDAISGAKSTKQVGPETEAQSLPTNPIPHELPSVTERTTQLIGVEEPKTNKMMDTKARQ